MERGYGDWAAFKFFLPIGMIQTMDSEVHFLMKKMSQTYHSVMDMPYSRRKRFVIMEMEDQKRAANAPATPGRSYNRTRR